MNARLGAQAYTVDREAPRVAIDAATRGTLLAMRRSLNNLSIDLESDLPWPADAAEALNTLEASRRRPLLFGSRRDITADIDLRDDVAFAAAVVIVPYTICATGITHEGDVAYNADDSG